MTTAVTVFPGPFLGRHDVAEDALEERPDGTGLLATQPHRSIERTLFALEAQQCVAVDTRVVQALAAQECRLQAVHRLAVEPEVGHQVCAQRPQPAQQIVQRRCRLRREVGPVHEAPAMASRQIAEGVDLVQSGVCRVAPGQRELVHHDEGGSTVVQQAFGRVEERQRVDVLRALLEQQGVPLAGLVVEVLEPRLHHLDGVAVAPPHFLDLRSFGRDAQGAIAGRRQPGERRPEPDADLEQAARRRQRRAQQVAGPFLGLQHRLVRRLEDGEVQVLDAPLLHLEQTRVDVERKRELTNAHGAVPKCHSWASATTPCCTSSCTTSTVRTCSAAA